MGGWARSRAGRRPGEGRGELANGRAGRKAGGRVGRRLSSLYAFLAAQVRARAGGMGTSHDAGQAAVPPAGATKAAETAGGEPGGGGGGGGVAAPRPSRAAWPSDMPRVSPELLEEAVRWDQPLYEYGAMLQMLDTLCWRLARLAVERGWAPEPRPRRGGLRHCGYVGARARSKGTGGALRMA